MSAKGGGVAGSAVAGTTLPYTGMPLWAIFAVAAVLLLAGLALVVKTKRA